MDVTDESQLSLGTGSTAVAERDEAGAVKRLALPTGRGRVNGRFSHMLFAQEALALIKAGGPIVLTSSIASLRSGSRSPADESSPFGRQGMG